MKNIELTYAEAVYVSHAIEDWLRYARKNNIGCDITLKKQEKVLENIKEQMRCA